MRKNSNSPKLLPSIVASAIAKWERAKGVSVLRQPKAASALAKLFWGGCDPVIVLQLLSNFARVGFHTENALKEVRSILKRVTRLSHRLKDDAKEIRAIDQHFLALNLDFPEEMEHFAEFLTDMYADELKSTALSRGGGLQSELVDAVQLLRMSTGRPHYPELAELIQALGGKSSSEDDLRKTVKNFKGNFHHDKRHSRVIRILVERSDAKWGKVRKQLQKKHSKT